MPVLSPQLGFLRQGRFVLITSTEEATSADAGVFSV
jgi:hypothetical protein